MMSRLKKKIRIFVTDADNLSGMVEGMNEFLQDKPDAEGKDFTHVITTVKATL
jgi:hypothetical protein